MQAQPRFNCLPTQILAVIFAVMAAMVLGATLAYVLKPPTVVPGRTQVIVVHDAGGSSSDGYSCEWTVGHKAC
jgi:hypothetical protein